MIVATAIFVAINGRGQMDVL